MDPQDFPLTCRICLLKDPFLIPLGSNLESSNESILDLIRNCSSVEIQLGEDTHLPQKVCQPCLDALKVARDIKRKCIESQRILRAFWPDTEFIDVVKSEVMEPIIDIKVKQHESDSEMNYEGFDYQDWEYEDNEPVRTSIPKLSQPSKTQAKKPKSIIPRIEFYDNQFQRRFTCDKCGEIYKARTKLLRHFQTIHKTEKLHQCNICYQTFRYRNGLTVHQKYHNNIKDFKCSMCPRAYVSNFELNKHKKMHQVDDLVMCNGCLKPITIAYLQRHKCKRIATEEESKALIADLQVEYTCDFCSLVVKGRPILMVHMKRTHLIAEGPSDFQCKRCSDVFRSRYDLINHNRTVHIRKKIWNCEHCQRQFIRRDMMENHHLSQACKANHQKCECCDRVFKTKAGFENHRRNPCGSEKAEQEKPAQPKKDWICEFCGKHLTTQGGLRRHYISQHQGKMLTKKPVKHICRFCERVFFYKCDLAAHIDSRHLKKKDFQCDQCTKAYVNGARLRRHRKLVHTEQRVDESKKIYACHFCPLKYEKEISLANHLLHHDLSSPDRPHHCLVCVRSFKMKKVLNLHMRTKHSG